MPLDPEAAGRALARLAGSFPVSLEELALGIINVVNGHMAKALRAVSLERGHDPRDFTLCCFGGAGGLHVCELAKDLEIRRIFIPAQAGVLSALGMALAGLRRDFSRSLRRRGPELSWERMEEEYRDLEAQGRAELAADGLDPGQCAVAGELEVRYRGQDYTLTVPWGPGFREEFQARHQRLYGHHFRKRPVEAVVLRLHFQGPGPGGGLPAFRPGGAPPLPVLPSRTTVRLPGGSASVPLFHRPQLETGFVFSGPVLVVEDYATLLVLPGFRGEVGPQGAIILTAA
jgi:N-methylhydantoinase A/oxoprolinase/acetone carboxylase beta subunit